MGRFTDESKDDETKIKDLEQRIKLLEQFAQKLILALQKSEKDLSKKLETETYLLPQGTYFGISIK